MLSRFLSVLSLVFHIYAEPQCVDDSYSKEMDDRNITILTLNRVKWPSANTQSEIDLFITNIAQNRKPIIIEEYPLTDAILSSLNNILMQQTNVSLMRSNRNCPILEYYQHSMPLSKVFDFKPPMTQIYDYTLPQIHSILSNQSKQIYKKQKKKMYECNNDEKNNDNYFVLTMDLMHYLKDLSFLKDTFCPKHLLIDDKNEKYQNEELEAMNLWFGYFGFITQLHYDASDNFNIQIKGKKFFRIVSPKYFEKLYLHSWLHPLSRKSQLRHSSLLEYELTNSSFFRDFEMYEIELNEGEIVYIPPMWLHEVVSVQYPKASMNVNIVSHSLEQIFQRFLFQLPVIDNMNALSLRAFYKCLLNEFGYKEYKKIIERFVESSYDYSLYSKLDDNDESIKKYEKKMKKICKRKNKMSEKQMYEIEIAAHRIYEWMAKNEGEHTRMMIMSYIEIFAHKVLPIQAIYFFFKYCF